MFNKMRWPLRILAAAGAWTLLNSLAAAHQRTQAAKDLAHDVHEWENEGGPARPAAPEHR